MLVSRFTHSVHPQSSKRVVGTVKQHGLAVLSAYEVSLLLGQSIHAVFVSPFKKRQARANLRVCVISGVLILHKNYCTVVISRIVFGVRCQCNAEGIVFSMSIYWQVTGCVLGCMSDVKDCLLYTSPSPRDRQKSRMPSSA